MSGRKGPFFSTTFSRPFKDLSGTGRNGPSFGLKDLEARVPVAHETKDWRGRSCLEVLNRIKGKSPAIRGLPSTSPTL